jgi:hypothetical protein
MAGRLVVLYTTLKQRLNGRIGLTWLRNMQKGRSNFMSLKAVDMIAVIITLSVAVILIRPMINDHCMTEGAMLMYEKVVMAMVGMLGVYVGTKIRQNSNSPDPNGQDI